MNTMDRPGDRFHWVWGAWFYHYYWSWKPAVTDDFGNLVRLQCDKAHYFVGSDLFYKLARRPYLKN